MLTKHYHVQSAIGKKKKKLMNDNNEQSRCLGKNSWWQLRNRPQKMAPLMLGLIRHERSCQTQFFLVYGYIIRPYHTPCRSLRRDGYEAHQGCAKSRPELEDAGFRACSCHAVNAANWCQHGPAPRRPATSGDTRVRFRSRPQLNSHRRPHRLEQTLSRGSLKRLVMMHRETSHISRVCPWTARGEICRCNVLGAAHSRRPATTRLPGFTT